MHLCKLVFCVYTSVGWSQGRVICVAQEAAKATEHSAPVDEEVGHVAVLWPHCQWVLTGHVQRNLQDVLVIHGSIERAGCRNTDQFMCVQSTHMNWSIFFFFHFLSCFLPLYPPHSHTHTHAPDAIIIVNGLILWCYAARIECKLV